MIRTRVASIVLVTAARIAVAAPPDVAPAAQRTDRGKPMLAVAPKMFAAIDGLGALAIVSAKNVVIAANGGWISVFDLATGSAVRAIPPAKPTTSTGERLVHFATSADGTWLAASQGYETRVWKWPYAKPEFTAASCLAPCAISHDAKLLACDGGQGPEIWDLAAGKRIVEALKQGDGAESCAFSANDRSISWAGGRAVMRWQFADRAAPKRVLATAELIRHAAFARDASRVVLAIGNIMAPQVKNTLLELATGKTTTLGAGDYELDATGTLAAIRKLHELDVVKLATGKLVGKAELRLIRAGPVRFADQLLAYFDGSTLRIADLPALNVRKYPGSKFAGWLGDDAIGLDFAGSLFRLALGSGAWSPGDRANLSAPPAGAPAWATWSAGGVAAEPSDRHDATPSLRAQVPCDDKLRVWTTKGGAKTVAMHCMPGGDEPGWEIGGGWVAAAEQHDVTIYNPQTGAKLASLPALPDPPTDVPKQPEFAAQYFALALAPTADELAVIWRRARAEPAELPDPRRDALHNAETAEARHCIGNLDGCVADYTIELWRIGPHPTQIWRLSLDTIPTGALAFDRGATLLVVGMQNGEIRVVSTAADHATRTEHLHDHDVTALSVAPGGHWVWSQDAAHDQRIWPLD